VATAGVVLAAVYMIRFYQRSMHNREGPEVESRDLTRWEAVPIAALVAVILALGVYPNFVARRSEQSVRPQVTGAALLEHAAAHGGHAEVFGGGEGAYFGGRGK
jgi:NADH-quinone oxidoreductase subunit M